ncbi:SulP family inorganic anion transporter [Microbulbifer sp. TYP-18]|uniref:SulP family inorganic anion transporter n=1 Tax=Microbulbifer sp. TYP-18 TaxID=3230024 RepID=UPI0034C62288
MRNLFRIDLSHWRGDLYGGLTAGIVALPLALAFGVASGLGPMAGLYGAMIVGFFASWMGGTPTNVSGPTGPMVVVLAGLFASLSGDVGLILTTVFIAGLLQVAFGFLGLGQYIRLVPYPVISGFMSGIGLIIIILQSSAFLGHSSEGNGPVAALLSLPGAISHINYSALFIGALSLATVYLWPAKWGRFLPGPLAALILATVIGLALPNLPVLGNIPTGLPSFQMPSFDMDMSVLILEAAFILAILGTIDSLLTSLVADNMTRTRHDSNRELIGQGVGNAVSGLFGGISGAGATMRTVINIRTGGSTRLSGMVHSAVLGAVILGIGPLLSEIPHAALAGVLVKVGMDIVDLNYLKRAHRGPRWDLLLMVLVLGLTVMVDLITAVGLGVVLAALAFVRQMAQLQLQQLGGPGFTSKDPEETQLLKNAKDKVTLFEFGGPLSFAAAADLGHHIRSLYEGTSSESIILDFNRVPYIDVSAAMAVETIARDAKDAGKKLLVCGMAAQIARTLDGLGMRELIPPYTRFEARLEALQSALQSAGLDKQQHSTRHLKFGLSAATS